MLHQLNALTKMLDGTLVAYGALILGKLLGVVAVMVVQMLEQHQDSLVLACGSRILRIVVAMVMVMSMVLIAAHLASLPLFLLAVAHLGFIEHKPDDPVHLFLELGGRKRLAHQVGKGNAFAGAQRP
ncbi:hypothetical protein [Adlercreutzia sp. ZJ242]|uniref:hypothetical protein n=1 Tax=Adlercreutzia sp. ZJ242 TaxID=2709409 RepID=UPI0013ED6336|nr:hypothetical protein [Adlercreutzia sp. ZJ242]